MAFPPDFGEEELKWKFERCINDLMLKSVTASTLSLIGARFFSPKHTKSLVGVGLGAAVGLAWFICEREMQMSMRICKDGVAGVVVCEECKKAIEERRREREQRTKEQTERKRNLEKKIQEGVVIA